jgi:hypothetical protein
MLGERLSGFRQKIESAMMKIYFLRYLRLFAKKVGAGRTAMLALLSAHV